MNLYDYSFNNNYLLFQNTPSTYSNFDYTTTNSTLYHDYNPMQIPSYNHFASTSTPLFTPSLRHSSSASSSSVSLQSTIESGKCAGKSDSTAIDANSSINLGKIHNTSEHVQELNQMCLIKDPKEFEKNMMSESQD